MSVGDDILVYGDDDTIKASIDVRQGRAVAREEPARASTASRRSAGTITLLATIQLGAGDRPSLRSMITGATGPRAVSFSVRGDRGIDVQSSIDTATPSAGAELAKLLEREAHQRPHDLQALAGPDLGTQLATVAARRDDQGRTPSPGRSRSASTCRATRSTPSSARPSNPGPSPICA